MIKVDAIAERDELLRIILLGDLMNGIQETNNVLCENLVVLDDFLWKR